MSGVNLFLSLLLLAANGFFVAIEFALVASRRTKLEQEAEAGHPRAGLALDAMQSLSLQLAGAQLGITMASLALGFLAEPTVAHLLESAVESVVHIPESVLHTGGFIVSLTIVVFLHMTLGEMVPKNIAITAPERTTLALVSTMRLYMIVFGPVVRFLNALANGSLRIIGIEPQDELHITYTADELANLVADAQAEGSIEDFEGQLVSAVLRFAEGTASDHMVPRERIVAMPVTATVAEIEQAVVAEGHSRIIVYNRTLDDAQGFVHAKDLLAASDERRDLPPPYSMLRNVLRMPADRTLRDVLLGMRRTRIHLAIITNDEGDTVGLITLEDVLEQLVGQIRDEHDRPRRRRPVS